MRDLETAIFTKFETGPPDIYTDLSGKLYLAEAPQTEALPYCVFDLIGTNPDYHFDFRHEVIIIRFTIYTDDGSATNIETYSGHLKTLYDDCTMAVAGYTQIDFDRQFEQLIRNPAGMVWQQITEYEVLMSA